MRRQSIILLAGIAGIITVGCGGTETPDEPIADSPTSENSPAVIQPFEQPLVSEQSDQKKTAVSPMNKISGLLEPTDPEERAKQVQASIRSRAGLDPFASLPPILTFSTPIETASTGGGFRGSTGGGSRSGGGSAGNVPSNVPAIPAFPEPLKLPPPPTISAAGPSGGSGAMGGGTQGTSGISSQGLNPLPEIPEPTLAQAVEVTGVVTIGGTTKAIVKAPNEPTGRHVSVGQRLSNGQVLVKRIEANAGSDPIVILEENGVEVSRRVGDKPAGGDQQTA